MTKDKSQPLRVRHDGGYGFGPEGPPMIVVKPSKLPAAKFVPGQHAVKNGLFFAAKEFIWRIT